MIIVDLIKEFPLDPDLIHLNHAAVGPWPRRTARAVHQFADENLHRGSSNYLGWLKIEQQLRKRLARLINADSSDEIALLKNTSEALSVIAYGLEWQPGENVVISNQEFPSNRIVWESLSSLGVECREVDISGCDPEEALIDAMDSRTRLLSVSSVQYATGLRLDCERLGEACTDRSVLFCIDAIQSLGAVELDAQACRADFICADGHKWLMGPEGLALFYVRSEVRERLRLHQYGWHMVEGVGDFDQREWHPANSGRRFECGSPNTMAIHALDASLSLFEEIGLEQVYAALASHMTLLHAALDNLKENYLLLSPTQPERRAGIITVKALNEPQERLFQRLQEAGVICAQRGGGIRLSPHFYTPSKQLEEVISIL